MNDEHDIERRLGTWVVRGADAAPERSVLAALDTIGRTPQRRPWVAALDDRRLRLSPASGPVRALALLVIALAALLLAGVIGVGTTPAPRTFQIDDLQAIVLWDDTKPAGWTLDSLITTGRDVATLPVRSNATSVPRGYVGGRYADFSGPDSVFISWAALFETPADADAALAFYANEISAKDAWGLGPGQPVELGDDGTVFTGVTTALMGTDPPGDPVPMRLYLWRSGNLLLAFGAWFDYDPDVVRSVVEGIDARAR